MKIVHNHISSNKWLHEGLIIKVINRFWMKVVHNSTYCASLFDMYLRNVEEDIRSRGYICAILMDLSKSIDC